MLKIDIADTAATGWNKLLNPMPCVAIGPTRRHRLTAHWALLNRTDMEATDATGDDSDSWEQWFKRVWANREDTLYPTLFGPKSVGIFALPATMLTETFQQPNIDPRWLHYGVFQYAPTPTRSSWLYVTSGMSNAWNEERPDPTGVSGLGCEFIFETTEAGQWPILRLLHVMAFQILVCHGRYPGRPSLNEFDRIPLRCAIDGRDSRLRSVMLAPSPHGGKQQLESGTFDFLQVVGITEEEALFARQEGGPKLLERLAAAQAFPVTDPMRSSLCPEAS